MYTNRLGVFQRLGKEACKGHKMKTKQIHRNQNIQSKKKYQFLTFAGKDKHDYFCFTPA